jgi:hypothetical protein
MSEVRSTDDGVEYTSSRPPVAPSDSSGALCERVEIEATKNGGFTARKFYAANNGSSPDASFKSPDTYAFTSLPEVTTFLGDAFGAPAPPAPAPVVPDVETQHYDDT